VKSDLIKKRKRSQLQVPGQSSSRDESEINENREGNNSEDVMGFAKTQAMSESAIRVSELSYRRLFEAAQDGILILDAETGRITDVNPFLFKLLGFSQSEMIGRTMGELSPFQDVVSNQAVWQRLQRGGYIRYEDLPLETKDGRKISVEFIGSVYEVGDKKVIQCNIRDITERKRAEEARQTSEGRYRTLFDFAPDGIVIADAESTYLDANPSMCRMLGYSHDEFVGLNASDIVVTSEIPYIAPALTEIKANSNYHREWRFRRKDGSVFEAEVIAVPMPDGNLLGLIRDTTERKRIEARFRRLVDSNVQGVMFWDRKGEITGANEAFLRLVGYSREDLKAHRLNCDSITPPEWAEVDRQGLEEVSVKGISVPYEKEFLRQDGSRVPVLVGSAIFEDCPDEGVCFVLDISRRKKIEAEVRQLNAELEQRVAERMGDLQAANKELEAFSYSVSHDLRAPLRHAIGFVKLLQQDAGPSLSEANSRRLTIVAEAAERMGTLIDDLLSFSRIGRAELQKTDIDFGALVQEALGDFQLETKERKIVWKIQALPSVRGDRALLRLALLNLISNAVKFTRKRAVAEIEIGCGPESGSESESVFFIRDNGAGFNPKYADKLFGVFQRLHSQAEFEGTGIGLANIQRIIQRHGGRIWAEGVVDGGATFYFSILKPKRDIS
jgi:PAS domain S-box-containing protein